MLELKNICFEAEDDQKEILKDINLKVPAGKFMVITGPNGGGKSTLARIIAGIQTPTKGQILFEGQDITSLKPYQRAWKGISYVPQGHMVFPTLTVEENLQMGESINPIKGKKPNYDLIYEYFPNSKRKRDNEAGSRALWA